MPIFMLAPDARPLREMELIVRTMRMSDMEAHMSDEQMQRLFPIAAVRQEVGAVPKRHAA